MDKDYVGIAERFIREKTNRFFGQSRLEKLKRSDFSIISNNCWAGSVYRYFGLPYQSPTAGLYLFAEDYVKFAADLKRYLSLPVHFIHVEESRHYEVLKLRGEQKKPIARLDDIEIVFLHYATREEAEAKWRRRADRVNWKNLFIKFSQMNECSYEDVRRFDAIEHPNKLCFTAKPHPEVECAVYHPSSVVNGQITNDTDRFDQNFDLYAWLNRDAVPYR